MKVWLQSFHRDKRGVAAIEYALLAALIVAVIVGAVGAVGTQVGQLYNTVENQVILAVK